MNLNWMVSSNDQALIERIGWRAHQLAKRLGMRGRQAWQAYLPRDAMMDVTAAHANGMPLALAQLLAASDANFAHDVFGIRRFLDRNTGKLELFRPRFAAANIAPGVISQQ